MRSRRSSGATSWPGSPRRSRSRTARSPGTARRAAPRCRRRTAPRPRAARVTATGSPSSRYRSRSSDASLIERCPSTTCTPSTPTAAVATSSRAGGVATASHHRADRGVLHVRHVVRIRLQRGIGDAPRERHRVAGAHDLLLGREHAAGVLEHVARAGHVGEHLRRVAVERVHGDVHAAAVGEALQPVGRLAHLVQRGRRDVALARHDPGQRDVRRQVLEVVPAVPVLDRVGVAVDRREDDPGDVHDRSRCVVDQAERSSTRRTSGICRSVRLW